MKKETFDDWLLQKKLVWRRNWAEKKVSRNGREGLFGMPQKRQKPVSIMEGFVREAAS